MPHLNYREMSLIDIHDDLLETLSDLYYNAHQQQLESLLVDMQQVAERLQAMPSLPLIEHMEELYQFDANLLHPRAQQLMCAAVAEMVRLADQ